jgi:hypothetical protein
MNIYVLSFFLNEEYLRFDDIFLLIGNKLSFSDFIDQTWKIRLCIL